VRADDPLGVPEMNVTSAAADVIEKVRRHHDIPDGFGVRLFPSSVDGADTRLAIDFANWPTEGDEVSEQHGTLVFVASDVAPMLADAELDAIPFEADDGGQPVRLVLRVDGRLLPED
jgi:Fe-S cluster assembly iron-binding protein IscA